MNDLDALGEHLRTRWLGRRHIHVAECASTNDLAAVEARGGAPEGTIVTADAQTGGRGRLGRVWHSPPGENLYFSIVLRPRKPAVEIPPITLLAGAAIATALRGLGFVAEVKWPNDVLLRGGDGLRKVAGVLTEAASEGDRITHVVLGMGINVNTSAFPEELAARATSLRLASGAGQSRGAVLAAVLGELEGAYERFAADGVVAATRFWESCSLPGSRCRARVDGIEIEGATAGLAPDGALQIRDADGKIHRIVSGEVIPMP